MAAMSAQLTVAIIARNAASTIGAALRSVIDDSDSPIILVDDFSDDATVDIARNIAGGRLTVVRPDRHVGTGLARQTALDAIETPYGLWIDADDVALPGRVSAMLSALQDGADLVYEDCYLVGQDGSRTLLSNPRFLEGDGILRSFERNWIHGLWGGFNVYFARTVGYDPAFTAAEDYDFLLRALAIRPSVAFIRHPLVLHYDRPGTVSRNIGNANAFTARAKHKFSVDNLKTYLTSTKLGWLAYVQRYMEVGDYKAALLELNSCNVGGDTVAPYGKSAHWIATYFRAICALEMQDYSLAENLLVQLDTADNAAEVYNALGVAVRQLGREAEARQYFHRALELYGDYHDAKHNLAVTHEIRVTRVPLRTALGRNAYRI